MSVNRLARFGEWLLEAFEPREDDSPTRYARCSLSALLLSTQQLTTRAPTGRAGRPVSPFRVRVGVGGLAAARLPGPVWGCDGAVTEHNMTIMRLRVFASPDHIWEA